MHQLTQKLKDGTMEILDVPFPALGNGQVMVRNYFSAISAGTEGKTVSDARKGYIAKAKSRQKEVRQVIELIKNEGLLSTYNLVMNKLEAPSTLGYSTSGEVIALGEGVTEFKVGDLVACAGDNAVHADVVSIPINLCVKIPTNVSLEEAAFTTIASIAMQGIRQADLRVGENCVIIGMGLIGQITSQILTASGITSFGIDIDQNQVEFAKKVGAKFVYNRNQSGLVDHIMQLTKGYGTDAIIITAGTSSLDPIEFAGEIARKKGKVVVVGAVPTGFTRRNYYMKELDLRMSSSYGPGRYDINYESKGIDYPIGYVRFTEKRNMETYLTLLEKGELNIDKLITHKFSLFEAPTAYSMILEKNEPFIGVLIKYDHTEELNNRIGLRQSIFKNEEPTIGFIGAGSFAQNTLLPLMKNKCNFVGVATSRGNNAKYVADKYDFTYCAGSAEDILTDKNINTIFITTRHNTHADYLIKSINSEKHVFVEKPLAMNETELLAIKEAYEKSDRKNVMVGFNRRFSPAVQHLKNLLLEDQPKTICIRINAGAIPRDHWVNDPQVGGGRVIGEACHFIDLAAYLAGGKINSVSAFSMDDADKLNNSVVINLKFSNGSSASLSYFSNGNKLVPKEYIEVFCGGIVAQIDDFKVLKIYDKSLKKIKFKVQDKGHMNEIKYFLESIKNGKVCPIPFEESFLSTLATFKVLESLSTGRSINI
jgi:polar amino acid transport system substrate-binding protein